MKARQFLESFARPLEVLAGEELAYVLIAVPTSVSRGTTATAHHVTNLRPESAARVLAQYAAGLAKPSAKRAP